MPTATPMKSPHGIAFVSKCMWDRPPDSFECIERETLQLLREQSLACILCKRCKPATKHPKYLYIRLHRPARKPEYPESDCKWLTIATGKSCTLYSSVGRDSAGCLRGRLRAVPRCECRLQGHQTPRRILGHEYLLSCRAVANLSSWRKRRV